MCRGVDANFQHAPIHPLEFEFIRRHSLILLNMVNFSIIFALVCLILTTTTFGRIAKDKPFVCPSDGHFADPEDCTRFFRCANGHSWPQFCPASLFWNQGKYFCQSGY